MDTTHSTAACNKCKQCGRILTKDEIGLHKKLYNRGATSYFCIDCSSQYLEIPVPLLQKKIEEFKAMGCTQRPVLKTEYALPLFWQQL